MDIIFLEGLEATTVIGIYEWEKKIKQTVELHIEIACDITKAAETDDIRHTVDYKAVSECVVSFIEQSEYSLVEKLIEETANILLTRFNTSWVKITLNKKGAISRAKGVGIIIERGCK